VLENTEGLVINEALVQLGLAKSSLLSALPEDMNDMKSLVYREEMDGSVCGETLEEVQERKEDVSKV